MKKLFLLLSLFLYSDFVYTQTRLTQPVRDSHPNISSSNGDVIWFGYTPIKYENNAFSIYYIWEDRSNRKFATSLSGDSWNFVSDVNAPSLEAIIKRGNTWYMGYHTTGLTNVYFNTTQSSDGLNFPPGVERFPSGEDMSIFLNNDSFYCYIRPKHPGIDPRRKIGLMKSYDFINWTPIQKILSIDDLDYFNPNSQDFRKQLYSMAVFKNGSDWWGLLNIYRVGNNGQDVEQDPPYAEYEHTAEVHLVYSNDGVMWQRTNNRHPFITRPDGIMQSFGLPTVKDDSLYVYAVESKRRHTMSEDSTHNVNGRWYEIWRYRMSLEDLEDWKPVTLNVTAGIEGFYNSASNTHNLNDKFTILLRKNFYPYEVVGSADAIIDSVTLTGKFSFSNIPTGFYYIVIRGRNCIETWSKSGGVFLTSGNVIRYDFTSSVSQAYGNNLKLKGSKYFIYSGDLNQDGIIDATDISRGINAINNGGFGYVDADVTGDGFVDASDLNLVNSNLLYGVSRITP